MLWGGGGLKGPSFCLSFTKTSNRGPPAPLRQHGVSALGRPQFCAPHPTPRHLPAARQEDSSPRGAPGTCWGSVSHRLGCPGAQGGSEPLPFLPALPPSRCLPRSADATENPMIYACPGAACCPGCRWRRIHSAPERSGRWREERERGGKQRDTHRHTQGRACPHPGAPSRPPSPGPHTHRILPHHRLIWALADPITYNKQFRLSLSESLSKLAT